MLPYLNVLSHHSHESESTEIQLTDTYIHTNQNQATHQDTGRRTLDRIDNSLSLNLFITSLQ